MTPRYSFLLYPANRVTKWEESSKHTPLPRQSVHRPAELSRVGSFYHYCDSSQALWGKSPRLKAVHLCQEGLLLEPLYKGSNNFCWCQTNAEACAVFPCAGIDLPNVTNIQKWCEPGRTGDSLSKFLLYILWGLGCLVSKRTLDTILSTYQTPLQQQ